MHREAMLGREIRASGLYYLVSHVDKRRMRHRPSLACVRLLVGLSVAPALVLYLFGGVMVMPPWWVHFFGVGATALAAAVVAVALMMIGARRQDPRTVVLAGGFTIMAMFLAVHGIFTPGVLVGMNGVVAITGALTLPLGAGVLALSGVPVFTKPRSIPWVLGMVCFGVVGVTALSIAVAVDPGLVPGVPAARSHAAWALLAAGLVFFAALAFRAANTFLLTRRLADLAVVAGLVLLAYSLYAALALTFMDLGWWIGHAFELLGIALLGASVIVDLRRGRRSQSRALIGDLGARDIVWAEEAFLGARVRALMVRLAEKDSSTEEHTRRVAALSVALGEHLGLAAPRLRALAIGGLLHDIGKLSVPEAILRKPDVLDGHERAIVERHPELGWELLGELGGFDDAVARLVLGHHERLDGSGYPRGLHGDELDLELRILGVCDVYDALVSPRVYRPAWSRDRALSWLGGEARAEFDPSCVAALTRLVTRGDHAPAALAS